MDLKLESAARALEGNLTGGVKGLVVQGVSTDSRTTRQGDLFIALRGERFDGHAFIKAAVRAGAVAVTVETGCYPAGIDEIPVITVEDTRLALSRLARFWRRQWGGLVIAVTGSSGKTTTKDMVAAALSPLGSVQKTRENYNNEIGLPLTILSLRGEHRAAILEMGMRGRGEIDFLAGQAWPHVGIITNIGPVHIERLGSLENIALAKGELLNWVLPGGTVLLNGDDPWCRYLAGGFPGKVDFFGLGPENRWRAEKQLHQGQGGTDFWLSGTGIKVHVPVPGEHNVVNALAALGVAHTLGVDLVEAAKALERVELSSRRQSFVDGPRGSLIMDDTYNANPQSTVAALRALKNLHGKRFLAVLGEMLELGCYREEGHRMVGAEASALGIDLLLVVGEGASGIATGAREGGMDPGKIRVLAGKDEAARILLEELDEGDVVLLKASRGIRLDELMDMIRRKGEEA